MINTTFPVLIHRLFAGAYGFIGGCTVLLFILSLFDDSEASIASVVNRETMAMIIGVSVFLSGFHSMVANSCEMRDKVIYE